MNSFIKPAVSLMGVLRYPKKMFVMSVFFIVPLIIVSYLLMAELGVKIGSTEKEQRGLEFIKTIRLIYQNIPQHRGMTNAFLHGSSDFKQRALSIRVDIDADINKIDALDALYGQEFKSQQQWLKIKNDWAALERGAFDGAATDVFRRHTELIGHIYRLIEKISSESGLMLDPEIKSSFLIDALVYRLPKVTENLGQARGAGAGIVEKGTVNLKQRVELGIMLANVQANFDSTDASLSASFNGDKALMAKLKGLLVDARRLTANFEDLVKVNVLESSQINFESSRLFNSGTAAIKANYKLYDAVVPSLAGLFEGRLAQLKSVRDTLLIVIVSSVLLAMYFFVGFYFSVINGIKLLGKSVAKISDGDLTAIATSGTTDELGDIAAALNDLVLHLHGIVSRLNGHVSQLSEASSKLYESTESSKVGAEDQQVKASQIATSMDRMCASISGIASDAELVAKDAQLADQEANGGGVVIRDTIASIETLANEVSNSTEVVSKLEENSSDIGSVLDVIRSIADQTNLLALNAAIEAARAGEHGRGFAVVADEVRTLAGRTQESTAQIQQIVEKLQGHTTQAVQVMGANKQLADEMAEQAVGASSSINAIIETVGHIMEKVERVALSSENELAVAKEVGERVLQVKEVAETSVGSSEALVFASEELAKLAQEIEGDVYHFKTQ